MIPYKQLSLADIFQDCQEKFENDKPTFLSLLEQHIDMDEIIPLSPFIGNGNRGNLRNGHSVLVKHDFSRYRIKFLLFFLNLVRCRSKDTDTLFPFLNIPVKIFLLSLES